MVDRNGRVLYYAQHMNADFVKFIDDHHFRDVANIFEAPADLEFPRGCLELKSSWKILGPDDDASTFYVTDAECVAKVTDLMREPTRAVEMGRVARTKAMRLFELGSPMRSRIISR